MVMPMERTRLSALSQSSRSVIAELLHAGSLPRAALARRLGQSPASLTKITRPLLDSGVITEEENLNAESAGRPGTPLAVAKESFTFIGVKLTEEAVFGVRTNAQGEVQESRSEILENTDPEHALDHIVNCINELAGEAEIQAVGIGSSGKMHRYDRYVRKNLFLGWDTVAVSDHVETHTGIPTVVSSDIRALTSAVQWSGPGRGHQDFAVVTIGVGLGLGLVVEGQVVDGAQGGAGLIDHLPVGDTGKLCKQGHRGCASSYLHTEAITHSIALAHKLPGVDLEGACAFAETQDAVAVEAFNQAGNALGVTLASVVNILGTPRIILTGDGLPMWPYIRESMEGALASRLDPQADPAEISIYDSGFDEWARGAAVVACQWALTGAALELTR